MDKKTTLDKLIIAHKELVHQRKELEECNGKLARVNKKLHDKRIEKNKHAAELNDTDESNYAEHTVDLDNLAHVISHKVRKSVANILGISNVLIENEDLSAEEIKELIDIIIQSAQSLNIFTEELSHSIHSKRKSRKV